VEGTLRHVCVDPATMTKRELPAFLRARLRPFLVGHGQEADDDGEHARPNPARVTEDPVR